ncbi:408_t:CDS:2 [Entrophospora sp. SA101]|nr:15766_t:CDS:2 [Entrophospora sp. SA101]CAJ0633451.1 6694_t:CDS:2 [Entrophospora sp. SA101]CAJ0747898.1 408_t:CDS:2 [Entrophospora sp. SA101]CAJ0839515.1 13257_t:CDS:2 [Entrophospora sp. SA101]CAJ0846590.1 5801_t:CDS:2 [Entrophospora sp. SA101]
MPTEHQQPVDPSHLLNSSKFLESLRKLHIDSFLQEISNKPLEPLVYAHSDNKISFVLNLLRIHNIISIPVFDNYQNKFVSIVNVVNINRYLMLKEVFSRMDAKESAHDYMSKEVKQKITNVYEKPISDLIDEMNLANNFKIYHKSEPLIDGLEAMGTHENVYAILASTSNNKEIMASDVQHAAIITQWDAIDYFLKNPVLKEAQKDGALDWPANKVMQRSWITFTKKDDPNQPSRRLPVSPVKSTFAFSITKDMTALAGFKVLAIHNLSSVAIVDGGDDEAGERIVELVDNLSSSDIRYLNVDNIAECLLPITAFLGKIRTHPKNIIFCHEDTNLQEIMRVSIDNGVHHVWVVEKESKKPIGVVSMSDMLAMFIGVQEG